jgi:hypothetical protein
MCLRLKPQMGRALRARALRASPFAPGKGPSLAIGAPGHYELGGGVRTRM